MTDLKILDITFDEVINSNVAIGYISYDYAIKNLVNSIKKTDFQRKEQDKKFYKKLERDLVKGCIMPPITIARLSHDSEISCIPDAEEIVKNNITEFLVLDGVQRLSTLKRINDSEEDIQKLDYNKRLYINVIFGKSKDALLYRMITLNNGQRPMTPRHQIEVLFDSSFDFEKLNITVLSEKDKPKRSGVYFKKVDLIQAYISFMAGKPLVDSNKLIQEKMDQLIVSNIINNSPNNEGIQFEQVISYISSLSIKNNNVFKWFLITNNLIALSAACRKDFSKISKLSADEFIDAVETFDEAFKSFNMSKIKVGEHRRKYIFEFFSDIEKFRSYEYEDYLEYFSQK